MPWRLKTSSERTNVFAHPSPFNVLPVSKTVKVSQDRDNVCCSGEEFLKAHREAIMKDILL
jgi:hypothetical protein